MKFTEAGSNYNHLERMSIHDLLVNINKEDQTVPHAVAKVIPQIEELVEAVVDKMSNGGRLFYIGAGTSGRLGVLDASECPPSFGVADNMVIGLIAGGDTAIRHAVEFAEDDSGQAWKDLEDWNISGKDVVVGITASGSTPYVVGGLASCRKNNILTGCITCNPDTPVEEESDFPVAVIVGPEFVTGSTRMKAGTAQKIVLNMVSTAVMIRLGKVKGNKMIDMQLSNNKLVDRGVRMIMEEIEVDGTTARELLAKFGSVRKAIDWYKNHA